MRMRVARILALAAWLPAAAQANVFDQFGFEPRGVAMGGAQVADAEGHVAAFFNPSMLALPRQASVGLGFAWIDPVTDVHAQAAADSSRLTLGAAPPTATGLSAGFLFPFGGKLDNRLAFGVGAYLPTSSVVHSQASTPNEPDWYFYQSKADRLVLAASLGLRVTDWLYVGGGVQVLGALLGGFDFRLNLFNQEFEQRALDNSLVMKVSPIAGLTLDFADAGLRVAFSYRAALDLDYDMPTSFEIADVGTITVRMQGHVHYTPHTMSLGMRFALGPIVAVGELRYALWSQAPDPAVQVSMTIDSAIATALGAEGRFDSATHESSPGFSNTLEPHVGLEWSIIRQLAVRVGYAFIPTPVPKQSGDTNILDGDAHVFGAGVGLSFLDPLEVFSKPIHIDLAYQLRWVPERRADKASTSDVPSYVYSANIHNLTAAVRYVF